MTTRKLRYDVNVPVIATIRFTTMASSITEAKADVCKRLAENDVQPEMFAYWLRDSDDPDYEIQWDSIYCWLHSGYHANIPGGSAEDLTDEELNTPILRPPGDPNARTDREKRLLIMHNDAIQKNNEYFLLIANKLAEKDFDWLVQFSNQTIEDSKKPDWNQLKNRNLDE